MKQVLALSHARKSYDGKSVLDDVTLAFLPGAKIGVVGPNGTGKSTLLRMMAGLEQPSNGEVRRMPGHSTGILAQEPVPHEVKTVFAAVAEGVAGTMALLDLYGKIAARLTAEYSDDLLDELGRLQKQLDYKVAWDLQSRLEQAMDALRCPPAEMEVSVLSGGERRRVALCRLLLSQPDLLLLDEPTNHLGATQLRRHAAEAAPERATAWGLLALTQGIRRDSPDRAALRRSPARWQSASRCMRPVRPLGAGLMAGAGMRPPSALRQSRSSER